VSLLLAAANLFIFLFLAADMTGSDLWRIYMNGN
jgi:hypothetical protein